MNEMDEVIVEFLTESAEGLDQIDRDLVELEAHPESLDIIKSIFRTMHTIKGTCGFLGFGTLETVTHAAESLLVLLRDGNLAVSEEIVSGILSSIDAVRIQIAGIEETGGDPENDYTELLAELHRLQNGPSAQPAPEPEPEPEPAPAAVTIVEPEEIAIIETVPTRLVGELLVEKEIVSPDELKMALQEQALGTDRRLGEILVEQGVTTQEAIEQVVKADQEQRRAISAESTIRVDVGVLDSLMNLIGELVLTKNQIVKLSGMSSDLSFVGPSQRLSAIASELQDEVMRVRMQPIGNAWSKIPRVVRDLAKSCGKRVIVETEGAESELDKTILEAIKDPLTHLVRNAVDHGIETPEERIAAGKPPEGRLTMRAYHESGTVIIEIGDDGAGIDADKIRRKVVQKGLMTVEEADRSSDRDILDCIFLAGFSTAEKTTTVSGRGVGMDVVKSKIESIRGTVELQTEPGQGTTFLIRIPLTLAIVPALMVGDGGQHYAIEQTSLVELVRLERDAIRSGIEYVHSTPVHRLRDRLLELIELGQIFGRATEPLMSRNVIDIVVLKVDGREFGLIVDETEDTQDVVVKPLGKHFANVPAFAGATIKADGGVALILDVRGLAQMAGARGDLSSATTTTDAEDHRDESDVTTLIVRVGTTQVALPLGAVVRLEEFPAEAIEHIRGQQRVQYRGELLPIVDGGYLDIGCSSDFSMGSHNGTANVIVCAGPNGDFGLIVDEIVDIVAVDEPSDGEEAIMRGLATAVVGLETLGITEQPSYV